MAEPMKEKPTCGSCRFFLREEGARRGECRAHPPQVANAFTTFPAVFEKAWCGEHSPGDPGTKVKVKPDKPTPGR